MVEIQRLLCQDEYSKDLNLTFSVAALTFRKRYKRQQCKKAPVDFK
jgi:hypothetical protein